MHRTRLRRPAPAAPSGVETVVAVITGLVAIIVYGAILTLAAAIAILVWGGQARGELALEHLTTGQVATAGEHLDGLMADWRAPLGGSDPKIEPALYRALATLQAGLGLDRLQVTTGHRNAPAGSPRLTARARAHREGRAVDVLVPDEKLALAALRDVRGLRLIVYRGTVTTLHVEVAAIMRQVTPPRRLAAIARPRAVPQTRAQKVSRAVYPIRNARAAPARAPRDLAREGR